MNHSIKELKRQLADLNIRPKKSLGQNFLNSPLAVAKIIQAVKHANNPLLFEIGPGLGALTHSLLQMDLPLVVLEVDRKIVDYWQSHSNHSNHLRVEHCDAMDFPWAQVPGKRATLVSNLPYQISARLLLELSKVPVPFSKMVLMFQREVADRVMASPKNGAYGKLSVITQSFWSIEKILNLSPKDFYPPPKVSSSVLCFIPKKTDLDPYRPEFLAFVKQSFQQRRKKLIKNFSLNTFQKERFIHSLEQMGKTPSIRAEEFSAEEFMFLFQSLREHL